jgi:hypothetical protein
MGEYSLGYENDSGRKLLFVEIGLSENTIVYDYQVEMLLNNPCANILAFEQRRVDNRLKFLYDISGYTSLGSYMSCNTPSVGMLQKILETVISAIKFSKKILLHENSFILDEDYIFLDNETIKMVYVPICTGMDFNTIFKDFVIRLMTKVSGDYDKSTYYEIINCVKAPGFKLLNFETPLSRLCPSAASLPEAICPSCCNNYDEHKIPASLEKGRHSTSNSTEAKKTDNLCSDGCKQLFTHSNIKYLVIFEMLVITVAFTVDYLLRSTGTETDTRYIAVCMVAVIGNLLIYKIITSRKPKKEMGEVKKIKEKPNKEERTKAGKVKKDCMATPIEACEETALLSPGGSSAYLLGNKDGTPVFTEIKGASFIIGRSSSIVDMVIKEKTIGRVHAEIVNRNNEFYIIDKNSKNGTFLNNELLDGFERKLESNDIIIFADKEYKFIKDFGQH